MVKNNPKNIVITGASSGLGLSMSQYFIEKENHVINLSRKSGYDLSKEKDRIKAIEFVQNNFKEIDILINNAGVILFEDNFDLDFANYMLGVNLLAPWHLITALNRNMQNGSNIINIASISGMRSEVGVSLYSATKAGMISLTRCFAREFAPKGIRVNCISPGFFKTNLVPGETPEELINEIPLKREASPIEIIPAIEMILVSTYMTGSNIVIDGGVL
jgi:NAD(P)-dependent dehydrogenase (short-subunit alcohol dehydrogenase family)